MLHWPIFSSPRPQGLQCKKQVRGSWCGSLHSGDLQKQWYCELPVCFSPQNPFAMLLQCLWEQEDWSGPHFSQTRITLILGKCKGQRKGGSCRLNSCIAPFPGIITNDRNVSLLEMNAHAWPQSDVESWDLTQKEVETQISHLNRLNLGTRLPIPRLSYVAHPLGFF